MRDASPEITQAVRAALMADAVLGPLLGDRVSTDWSRQFAAPFARLRVTDVSPFQDGCGGEGSVHSLVLLLFSKERGASALGAMVDSARKALDDAPLSLATSSMWWCMFAGSTAYTDPDDPELQIARLAYTIQTTDGA